MSFKHGESIKRFLIGSESASGHDDQRAVRVRLFRPVGGKMGANVGEPPRRLLSRKAMSSRVACELLPQEQTHNNQIPNFQDWSAFQCRRKLHSPSRLRLLYFASPHFNGEGFNFRTA